MMFFSPEELKIKARGSTAHQLGFFFFSSPPFFYIVPATLIPGSRRGTNHNNTRGFFLQDFNLILAGDKKLEYFW